MDRRQIIMNFTTPPSDEDLHAIADTLLETLPEELMEFCEELEVAIEEIADEALEDELDLDDPFELMALYRTGRELTPGVEKKDSDDCGALILFRRPILDYWCDSQEDLNILVRQVMIEELGQNFDFSDDEIDDMVNRHFQGML